MGDFRKKGFDLPNLNEILVEAQQLNNSVQNGQGQGLDILRKRYLAKASQFTGRNTIAYYSGFLQKDQSDMVSITDIDKILFMQCIHGMDKSKGLDLILHTPGGSVAATESLVDYLKNIFGTDIRVIIPQIAMSAGTMIALASKEIIMGKQSNIGPIDPQFGGVSAQGVLDEFNRAVKEVTENPESAALWQVIIAKYHPTFLGDCQNAIEWSKEMVTNWLQSNMFSDQENPEEQAKNVVDKLSDHKLTHTHDKHVSISEAKEYGLKIIDLENMDFNKQVEGCKDFQDCILSIHHCYMATFFTTDAAKIVENDKGAGLVFS